jgi:ribosomal protein L37AE/L43A
MSNQVIDGRRKFGVGLHEWYNRDAIRLALARKGILVPHPSSVATDAAPALARVNPYDGHARWIADCPDCPGEQATYAWIETPLFLCWRCGNRGIGGMWRPVLVPGNRQEIERLLLKRPDPMQRAWEPGETIEELKADNATVGV